MYELTVTIILDVPYMCQCGLLVRIVIFFIANNKIFLNVFPFVRRVELCSHKTFLTFLFDCYINVRKFANILLNDLWNLCYQNFIIFSLISHIVLKL